MTIQCPTCSKVNPANATYCYYDGRALTKVSQIGPRSPGTMPFLTPFSFPDGQRCGNFDQLALACDLHWNDARTFLVDGIWCSFFNKIGRHDLASAAAQAANEADRDVGLASLLERLPTDVLRRPTLSLLAETEDLGALKPGTEHKFQLVIVNKGGLVLTGKAATNCEWLLFGDRQGNESRKLFQTRDHYTLFVRVIGEKLRANPKPLEGQIAIETNGGTMIVAVKATVPVLPFPNGQSVKNVLAGARSPREVALKARANPAEAASLFEQGAVKAWYTSNGWTYPVQGTQGQGKGAVQQFFEALGLSKPPLLEISTEEIVCQGEVGQQLTKNVNVSTKEAKYVHAEAHSDQPWIKVQPSISKGKYVTIPLRIEVPRCPGESLEAHVTIQGNGQQRFVVPVTLAVVPNSAEVAAAERAQTRRLLVYSGVAAALFVLLALGLVALIVYRPRKVPLLPPVVVNDPGQPPVPTPEPEPDKHTPANPKGGAEPPQGTKPDEGKGDNSKEGARPHLVTKTEVRWDGVPDQIRASIERAHRALKLHTSADCQEVLDRVLVKAADTDRFTDYENLAAKLPVLVHNLKTREPLARFLTECCVHEPSDLNAANVWRALGELFPKEGAIFNPEEKGRELDDALYARRILFEAMKHKAVKPERAKSLADEFGTVFGLALDTRAPPDELMVETEKLLAVRCYRNTLPTASKSVEHALTVRAVLIEKFPQHLPQALRNKVDADLLVIGLGKGNAALWPKLEPICKTCLASTDAAIRPKLIDAYTKANAELGGKMAVLLAPKWAAASAKLTPDKQVAALNKFLNIDFLNIDPDKKTSRVPAFQLLLNPARAADEEISLGVFKTLLGESNPLTAEEMDVLAEAVRDVKRRTSVRCFAVVNLGEGEHVARGVPALVDVLREKGDVKLLSLSLKALGRISDKRMDVLTALLALAMSDAKEAVRVESLQVLDQLEPSALSTKQILERWPAEKSSIVRQELGELLKSRLVQSKPEQMKESLLPVLRRKETDIVVVGLKVVQAKGEDAADVAAEVADLFENDNRPKVREASAEALRALGDAASKARPKLSQLLLDRWVTEKDPGVRQAMGKLLQSRLEFLKPEQMQTDLLPLLKHRDADIKVVGLKVVQAKKKDAADLAPEVADLIKHGEAKVREAALATLKALGPAASKALPKVLEILGELPKYQRSSLALIVADIVDAKDTENAARFISFLVEGLHPEALKVPVEGREAAINKVLLKIGQPAVEGIFQVIDPEARGKDESIYRRTLYKTLAGLGPSCKSPDNYKRLLQKRNMEKLYKDVQEAAGVAMAAMAP